MWQRLHYAVDFNNDDPARRALQLLNWGKTQLTCVTVSMFFKADSNGGRILDDLIKSGVLEKTPSTEVRLKRNGGDSVSRPEEIAGSNFDKIWFILQHQFQWDMPLPVDLPSPDVMQGNSYLTEIETTYALRTNTIWIKAMAFIFLHEYFHILLGHTKLINLTDEEKIEKEWEAETKALEHIRLPENFQNDDFIGVLSLMLCNFFEIVNIEQIVPQDHLPLNERLDKILQHIEFQCGVDLRRVQYFYHFSSIGLIYGLAPLDFDYSNTASSYFDTRDYFNRLYTIVMQKVNSR